MSTRLGSEIMDSRDLIARAKEIEEELEDKLSGEYGGDDVETTAEYDELKEELEEIQAIEEAVSEYLYGETLVREDYFEQYAQQLAEDIGAISPDASWPLSYIDWEAAADALRTDYTEVEYQGHTYLARA